MPQINISKDINAPFLAGLAGLGDAWGYNILEDTQLFVFLTEKMDAVEQALIDYPAAYLAHIKATKSRELATLRWLKTQHFTYDGVLTQADAAMAVVLGALELRSRRGVPNAYEQIWKLNENEFRRWTETDIENFGFGISDHIQACFDREEELSNLIWNAISVEEVEALDLTQGWSE